jgi:hypothetical protein
VDAPAAVLALVLAMTAVGSSVLLWFAPTFGAVRQGYEILTGTTIALLAFGAWGALRGPAAAYETVAGTGHGELALRFLLAMTVLTVLAVVVRAVKAPPVAARLLGGVATVAGLASFVPTAAIRVGVGGGDELVGGGGELVGGGGELVLGLAELVLGGFLLGAIWVGMILGHWYLVERRLTNRYMVWIAWVNVAAVGAGVASVLLSARNPLPCDGLTGNAFETCVRTFSPVLRATPSMTIVLGLGVLALIALIAGFNVKLAREGGRSIQASTGMFYLAVILAPAAEFAAKVRFFF